MMDEGNRVEEVAAAEGAEEQDQEDQELVEVITIITKIMIKAISMITAQVVEMDLHQVCLRRMS